jgi:hypothetical protein
MPSTPIFTESAGSPMPARRSRCVATIAVGRITSSEVACAAWQANGPSDLRHTITHLEFIDRDDVPRFQELGVVASMSLQWARRDGLTVDASEGYIESARLDRAYPARDLWRAGAVIAGGSDHPVDPLIPMVAIETAVDRTGEDIPGVYPGRVQCQPGHLERVRRDQDAHDQLGLPAPYR